MNCRRRQIEIQPVADGGEGTAEVICAASDGVWRMARVAQHLGEECQARYCWIARTRRAVFEMSEVAGLKTVATMSFDLDRATTLGVGEMILEAQRSGAREIVVGLGGSMTNDGGFGMARALGYEFLDAHGQSLGARVTDLTNLDHIRKPADGLAGIRVLAAADVINPLLGAEGATRIFAAQKGAGPDQINRLEKALTKFADVVERDLKINARERPGAGAAGGLGFGLIAFCGGEIRSGFQLVAEAVDLERKMAEADVVVTGEGSLDSQTLAGKAPGQVAAMASKLAKKVYAVVGRADDDEQLRVAFDGIFEVARAGRIDSEHVRRAPELLRQGGQRLGAHLAGRSQSRTV